MTATLFQYEPRIPGLSAPTDAVLRDLGLACLRTGASA